MKVPAGDVSVIPQPSFSVQPARAWKRCCTSSGSGAPPEPQYFSEERSMSAIPGYMSIAVNIVGTPMKIVIFFAAISLTTASRSNRGCSTISAPSRIQSSMHDVSA